MNILNLDNNCLTAAFRQAGNTVVTAGYHKHHDIVVEHPMSALALYTRVCRDFFVPDLIFYCDSSNIPYFLSIEEVPCLSIFYSIDTYCHLWHYSYGLAFDHVFVAQKGHLEQMQTEAVASWLPLFATSNSPQNDFAARDIPVAFAGTLAPKNIPQRKAFLTQFRRLQPLLVTSQPYAKVYPRAQIVLNQTAMQEINMRCFEAMAHGAALLMEECGHGLRELFTPGHHILPLYRPGDVAHAAEIVAKALENPARLAEIAANGHALAHARHLASHRVATICETLAPLLSAKAHEKRLNELALRKRGVRTSYYMLYDDASRAGMKEYADMFLEIARKK